MTVKPLGTTNLFKPLKIGRSVLQNRVVLAPLTRLRNDANQAPTQLSQEYYGQRGSAPGTLLVTEATLISAAAGGYDTAPGIWTPQQIAAWAAVAAEVHKKKSFIYFQLWHLGRASVPAALAARNLPYVSASAVYPSADAEVAAKKAGNELRALTELEIQQTISDYAAAAANSIRAGADGVEIHGANGYLIDQFLQSGTNTRTDAYGGSVENRARFALEVIDAVVAAVGADRTGIRISPWGTFGGMRDAAFDVEETFGYLVEQIERKHRLAYIHVMEPRCGTLFAANEAVTGDNTFIYQKWSGPVIRAGNYHTDYDAIEADVDANDRTLIAFGRMFISNPDLPRRLAEGLELTPYNRKTFYTDKAAGYTDYPFHE